MGLGCQLSDKLAIAKMMILSLNWPKASTIAAVREGVSSWEVMARLGPDGAKDLCYNIRKPGGGKDKGAVPVPYMAEVNFMLACGLANHFRRISRTPDLDKDFDPEDLEEWEWKVQAEKEKSWPYKVGEDTSHPKIVKMMEEDPHKAFRLLNTYLEN